MASSSILPRKTVFLEILSSRYICDTDGCERKVFFRFWDCCHAVCGSCLSKTFLNTPSSYSEGNVYCSKCVTSGKRTVSYVTYQEFLTKQSQKNFCTSCFGQKAIYRAPCGHLLCEPCLTPLCNSKPEQCNVKGCDFTFSRDIVKKGLDNASEMEIWQIFQLPKYPSRRCEGYCCSSKGVVQIVKCGHRLCLSCFKRRQKSVEKDIKVQMCNYHPTCASTFSKFAAERFMEKIEGVCLKTALNIEIRVDLCELCSNKKETLRIRKCEYLHTVCLDCMSTEKGSSSNREECLEMNNDKQISCKVSHCENKAPYECFEAMISVLKDTKLMPDIFFRNAFISEKCSRCKDGQRRDGFKTLIACSHALCEDCLQEIKETQTGKFYECEGYYSRCKYHVPISIIAKVLEDIKTPVQDSTGSNQNERSSFANVDDTCTAQNEDSTYAGKIRTITEHAVKKTNEDSLAAVPEIDKDRKRCEMCYKNPGIVHLKGCNHCFCKTCLHILLESAKDSRGIIDCPDFQCPSFVTVKEVEGFLGAEENSQKPISDTANNVNQNPLKLEKPESAAQNDQSFTTPDAASIKRKCETEVKTEKKKMLRIHKSFGLKNVGLSCYRNTILQTLAETPSFHNLLQNNTKDDQSPTWIKLLCNILGRIKEENTGAQDMLGNLEHFHFEFNKTNTEYRDFQQEDTLSFLNSVLNGIQASLKRLKLDKQIGDSGKLEDPTSIFQGAFKTSYRCLNCEKEEDFEGETFFSLPLPVVESKSVQGTTIGSCFEGFFAEEEIDGVPCTFCASTQMKKAMTIAHFPDILVLQLCKLEETTYGRFYKPFQKKGDRVQFWEDFSGLKEHNKKLGLKQHLKPYRLFSVVEHLGSASSGHYVCYVRRQHKWWLCDDSYVTEVKLKTVKKANAYILFYEKKESPV
nr:uncharacterized protein LOC105343809 isoform X4 [Crassostrea gigas]